MIVDPGIEGQGSVIFKIVKDNPILGGGSEISSISGILGFDVSKDILPAKIEVVAYSGYRANERPLSFVYQQKEIEVEEVIDRWYGFEHDYFKIRANDAKVYLIKWHRILDLWFLVKIMERMGKH